MFGIGLALILTLTPGGEVLAAPSGTPLDLSFEARVRRGGSARDDRCASSTAFEAGRATAWWVTMGPAMGGSLSCGAGLIDEARTSESPLAATVSVTAARLPAKGFVLELVASIRRISPVEVNANEKRPSERRVFFRDLGEDVVLPLVGDSAELLVKVGVTASPDMPAKSYGRILLVGDSEPVEVLLDGGSVAKLSFREEVALDGVEAGEHEIAARSESGAIARRAVDVKTERTVVVSFDPSLERDGDRLLGLGRNSAGSRTYRRERDGAVVIEVPSGELLMGNSRTERTPLEHRVFVSRFLIDETAVTWRQYKRFAAATGTALPPAEPFWGIRDDHPAVFVTWDEAKAYCEWIGGRLPTEAERERACRGNDTRMYPWGDAEPDATRAVYRRQWGFGGTDPVGNRPAGRSPYGVLDAAGNVWEWVADWYDEKYYEVSPVRNPQGPSSGVARVVRGGSWDSRPSLLSCSCRNFGYRGYREGDFGFRCAMNAAARGR